MWTRRHVGQIALICMIGLVLGSRQPSAASNLDPEDIADLNRVSAYLNDLGSLEGQFIQIASNGVQDSGTFYFRRPGGLRFEYDEPNPILIIANNSWVVLNDRKLKTVDRFPISATPLKLLLKKHIDLANEANIVSVEREPGSLLITVREDKGPAQGQLTMIFSDPALELMQWIITDAQGFTTTIALRDLRRDTKISPRLFRIDEAQPFRRR
ncbi:MAG: outer membrane lipoprotein carrier protein LolA [Alphaproteobacteria bacterium]|nr:MAG: outer membrane lipoprotein carrier protein LolA [Alphaproteobacteria bacterium]